MNKPSPLAEELYETLHQSFRIVGKFFNLIARDFFEAGVHSWQQIQEWAAASDDLQKGKKKAKDGKRTLK